VISEDELEAILGMHGKYHVRSLGTNLVSKILTVYDQPRWPLFNARVKKTFAHYLPHRSPTFGRWRSLAK
jgi:hypothetical protein